MHIYLHKYIYIYIYIYMVTEIHISCLLTLAVSIIMIFNIDINIDINILSVCHDIHSIQSYMVMTIIWNHQIDTYKLSNIDFQQKTSFRSKNRKHEIDVLSKNDRNYIFPMCRYHHSTRLDELKNLALSKNHENSKIDRFF